MTSQNLEKKKFLDGVKQVDLSGTTVDYSEPRHSSLAAKHVICLQRTAESLPGNCICPKGVALPKVTPSVAVPMQCHVDSVEQRPSLLASM